MTFRQENFYKTENHKPQNNRLKNPTTLKYSSNNTQKDVLPYQQSVIQLKPQ